MPSTFPRERRFRSQVHFSRLTRVNGLAERNRAKEVGRCAAPGIECAGRRDGAAGSLARTALVRCCAGRAAETRPGISRAVVRHMNLSSEYRAIARLGTRIVQEQQEALMASAWEQAAPAAESQSAAATNPAWMACRDEFAHALHREDGSGCRFAGARAGASANVRRSVGLTEQLAGTGLAASRTRRHCAGLPVHAGRSLAACNGFRRVHSRPRMCWPRFNRFRSSAGSCSCRPVPLRSSASRSE